MADDKHTDCKEEIESSIAYNVEEEVSLIWSEHLGLSVSGLCQELAKRHGISPRRERVKQAREAIPYRRVSSLTDSSTFNKLESSESSISQLLEQRGNYRATKRPNHIKLADRIAEGLTDAGIEINDRNRTWKFENPFSESIRVKIDALCKKHPGSSCRLCGRRFGSRNLVFEHLRNPASGCGASVVASGQSLELPPSSVKPRKVQTNNIQVIRRHHTGSTARHATVDTSLRIGNIPLPWTRPHAGKYKRLQALLYRCSPHGAAQPWIKTVVRKAYHDKLSGKYMGFAVVVYRDAEEAASVRQALDGKELDIHNVYNTKQLRSNQFASLLQDAPKIVLNVWPAKQRDIDDVGRLYGSTTSTAHNVLPPGSDPPLSEQLKPLTTEEVCRRIQLLTAMHATDHNEMKDTEQPDGNEPNTNQHQQALDNLVQLYTNATPARQEKRLQGREIPEALRNHLLGILETLRWPASNQRAGLTAERYLVLTSSAAAKDAFYPDLRQACHDLMQWADPGYYYSGIAVTKNFVASPHIDDRDQSLQYAVSLGDFTDGGELCVTGMDDRGEDVLNVIDTHNRMARADGRHVHWVRTWSGGDRYSLIFYDTSDRFRKPVLASGADLDYLSTALS